MYALRTGWSGPGSLLAGLLRAPVVLDMSLQDCSAVRARAGGATGAYVVSKIRPGYGPFFIAVRVPREYMYSGTEYPVLQDYPGTRVLPGTPWP